VGSIEAGKLANFTILADNPVTCPAENIKDIAVWGTIHEGRKLPVIKNVEGTGYVGPVMNEYSYMAMEQPEETHHHHEHEDGENCVCTLNRFFGACIAASLNDETTK